MPNSLAILGAHFEGEARGRAIGIWASVGAGMAAVGPILGGWLIDTVGWRAIFLINLPLAAGAIALALIAVREPDSDAPHAPLDFVGAVLATAALASLVWGLTSGVGPGGWSGPAIGALAGGALLAAAFVGVEMKKGDLAMTPPALFGSRALVGMNLMTFLLYGALGGFLVLMPYVMIEAGHYRATAAGAALLPFPLVMTVGGPIMGQLAGRFGSRLLLTFGPIVVAIGFVLATRLDERANYWTQVLPCILVTALGMTAAAAPLTTAILSSVDSRHTGSASGLNSAVARGGGLVATALIGGVLAAQGAHMIDRFRFTALIGAGVSVAAGICAFWALGGGAAKSPSPRRKAQPNLDRRP
jgi:MFS family permease